MKSWLRDLQLGHQCLKGEQEFASCVTRRRPLVKVISKRSERCVELFRFDHRPRDNLQFSGVKTSDEVSVLLVLNQLLKFVRESR
jgi:hypothetical protein